MFQPITIYPALEEYLLEVQKRTSGGGGGSTQVIRRLILPCFRLPFSEGFGEGFAGLFRKTKPEWRDESEALELGKQQKEHWPQPATSA